MTGGVVLSDSAVFCGASMGTSPSSEVAARPMGALLASSGSTMIDGCAPRLTGAIADEVPVKGGDVEAAIEVAS